MTAAPEPGPPMPPMIVLAGGLGTRLRGRIGPDLPKVLAPIHDHSFLDYLLAWCKEQHLGRLHFALGHHADAVVARLRAAADRYPFAIGWSIETEPRGTAGALALALAGMPSTDGPCLVMNGDTLVDVDMRAFRDGFATTDAELGLVAARVPDPGRYGTLIIDADSRVRRFAEKAAAPGDGEGWINAGIYLLTTRFQARLSGLDRGSLERDLFAALPERAIWAFRGAHRFLDIGTDASLDEAQRLLRPWGGDGHGAEAPVWRSA